GFSGAVNSLSYPADDSTAIHSSGGHYGRVNALALDPKEKMLISGSSDKTLKLWDSETGEVLESFDGLNGDVSALVIIQERDNSAAADTLLRFWDFELHLMVHRDGDSRNRNSIKARKTDFLYGPRGGINSLASRGDGKLIAAVNDDALLCLW